jgi:hypothetical protein
VTLNLENLAQKHWWLASTLAGILLVFALAVVTRQDFDSGPPGPVGTLQPVAPRASSAAAEAFAGVDAPRSWEPQSRELESRDAAGEAQASPDDLAVPLRLIDAETKAALRNVTASFSLRGAKRFFSSTADTDTEGLTHLLGAPKGQFTLTARVPGYLPTLCSLAIPTPVPDRPVTLELEAGLGLTGVVLDRRSQAVAGAQVQAHLRGGETHRARATTNATGRFELDGLPSGVYVLAAGAEGFQPVRLEASVKPKASTTTTAIEIRLNADPGFQVRVVDTDGHAIEGARVSLRTRTFGVAVGRRSSHTSRLGLAQLSGVALIPGASIALRATHPAYAPVASTVRAETLRQEVLELVMTPPPPRPVARARAQHASTSASARPGTITGRIETTRSLKRFSVRAVSDPSPSGASFSRTFQFSSRDLEFRLAGLPPGTYTVTLLEGLSRVAGAERVPVRPGSTTGPILLAVGE